MVSRAAEPAVVQGNASRGTYRTTVVAGSVGFLMKRGKNQAACVRQPPGILYFWRLAPWHWCGNRRPACSQIAEGGICAATSCEQRVPAHVLSMAVLLVLEIGRVHSLCNILPQFNACNLMLILSRYQRSCTYNLSLKAADARLPLRHLIPVRAIGSWSRSRSSKRPAT